MQNGKTVAVAVITKNEIDGMRTIMPEVENLQCIDQLYVVDGRSTDGTVKYCLDKNIPIYLEDPRKMGPHEAFKIAWDKCECDYLILFSPDGNSLTEAIPGLVNGLKQTHCDIIIASRYADKAVSYDDDYITAFGNLMFTRLFNFLYRPYPRIHDYLGMYRIYDVKRINELIDVKNITELSYGSLILQKAVKAGYIVQEIGYDEGPRIGGERKMRPLYNGWSELCQLFKGLWK